MSGPDEQERRGPESGNPTELDGRDRRQLTEILESITDPFSVFDEELRVTFINEAALKLTGFDRASVIGRRLWELVPEVEDTPFLAAYRRAIREKTHLVVEDYFAPWDRWFEASVFPLERGIAVYARDITERKGAEQLRERLATYAALRADVSAVLTMERVPQNMLQRCCELLVHHLGVAFARVWTLDDAGTTLILKASAGLYTHLNGPHGAVPVGQFKIGRIAADREAHLTNDVQNDPRIGNPEWARREGMRAFAGYPLVVDDELVGVLAMFSRTALAEDTLGALSVVVDLVAHGIARRRAEHELELRMEELARSNAELEQFAYVASHDLQEPLRVVASYNQLLARRYKGKLDSNADEFIAFTVEGVTRMQRLINDLLAYSRVGTRGRDFGAVELEKVLALAKANLERAIIEADAIVTHDPLPSVAGDEGQLVQLLQNLVGNSIKFRSDTAPRVHVSAKNDGAFWVISVRDNGIGVEPEYFDRIFVIFQRLLPREKYPGTGIGLAICKKIVERHGGRIWVESKPGEGTTMSFSLPQSAPRTARKRS